ncbi:MAG: trypsin-like peptidase domain-containing protein, partial [Cyanobacteria bacterium REEB65]|nr:trypsin-like peptidase domain-containing protein [Cyanobacteria bacterium REEB65]
QSGTVIQKGIGSGFVVNSDGLVVTNEHVVEGRSEMTVTLSDGRRFKGKVLGYDSNVDLALVKVPAKGLPALPLADSNRAEVGDWVEAFGSPLGLQKTVTAGIISAVNREFSHAERLSYLQTDAAINPGNSGGPLVLLAGQVVGMNTFIAEGAQGIGFAIPSNTIRTTIAQIRAHGTIARGWLGTVVARITPELGRYLGVKAGRGIVIVDVTPASPAAKAGLAPGDVVLEADGQALSDPQQLVDRLSHKRAGQTITLLVERGRQRKFLKVQLGAAPPSTPSLSRGS